MNRFLRHYDPKMPLYLARKAEEQKFNPEAFISWYLTYPDIAKGNNKPASKSSKRRRYLVYSAYYFWVIYIASALLTFFYAPILAVLGLLASPYIVAGVIYALLFMFWYAARLKSTDNVKVKTSTTSAKKRPVRRKR